MRSTGIFHKLTSSFEIKRDLSIFKLLIYIIFYSSMTETHSPQHPQLICSPFTDIVNQFMHKVQQDICRKAANPHPSPARDTGLCQETKQNQAIVEPGSAEKTIKLEKKGTQQNITSSTTIQRDLAIKSQQHEGIVQWDFMGQKKGGQISRTLRFSCPFAQISKMFIEFARKDKLMMFQKTESFVTVKKGASGSCRCFIKMWSNSQNDATVYQLRRYGKGQERGKLILVQGDQLKFHNFYLSFLRILDQRKSVRLLPGERVQLLFQSQNKGVFQVAKRSQHIIQRIMKQKPVKNQEVQALALDIKNENLRLKDLLKQIPDLKDLPTLSKQMEDLCFSTSGILDVFQELYRRDYELYRIKREKILKKFNIPQLFKQLQIAEHYQQYKRQRSFKQIELAEQKIPYMLAIRELKRFGSTSSNSVALQSAVIFHQKIRLSYNNYFKNSFKMGDMDDFLPITIFCVLAVDCDRNMLGNVKMLLSQFQALDEAEWEKKTLTDIEAAFEYILKEWDVVQ